MVNVSTNHRLPLPEAVVNKETTWIEAQNQRADRLEHRRGEVLRSLRGCLVPYLTSAAVTADLRAGEIERSAQHLGEWGSCHYSVILGYIRVAITIRTE